MSFLFMWLARHVSWTWFPASTLISTPLLILAWLTSSSPFSQVPWSPHGPNPIRRKDRFLCWWLNSCFTLKIYRNIRALVHACLWIWVGALRGRGTTRYGIRGDLALLFTLSCERLTRKPRGKSNIYWFIMKTDRDNASHINGKWLVNRKKVIFEIWHFPMLRFCPTFSML